MIRPRLPERRWRTPMLAGAAAMAMALSHPIAAETPPSDATFPEMSPEQTLPKLLRALRDNLTDPGSVTNFSACYPPVRVRMVDGRPVRWTVMFALNSKNQSGGYTGLTEMAAVFYADKPIMIAGTLAPPTHATLARCTHIPDAEVHRMIEAE